MRLPYLKALEKIEKAGIPDLVEVLLDLPF